MAEKNSSDATPDFQQIQPSLENISDLLSIIGANANVVRIGKDTAIQKNELYGCIGFGPVDGVFSCRTPVEDGRFLPLGFKKNAAISAALLNITYPKAFDDKPKEDVLLESEKISEAAFAQNFISRIEVKRKAYSGLKLSQCFGVVLHSKKVYLLCGDKCWDETAFFQQHIWKKSGQNHCVAAFGIILTNRTFKENSGMLLAVVHDGKLQLKKKLTILQSEYSKKYGNYDNDRTMSKEDWANVSALNATISEAESFELVIEGPKGRRTSGPEESQDVPSTSEEERYIAFCKIKDTERKLWAEQEKFKYSMIPGRDVAEARKEFFDQLKCNTSNKRSLTLPRTPLATNTSHNLMHRKCLSTGNDREKLKRKTVVNHAGDLGTPRRSRRLKL